MDIFSLHCDFLIAEHSPNSKQDNSSVVVAPFSFTFILPLLQKIQSFLVIIPYFYFEVTDRLIALDLAGVSSSVTLTE